MRKVFFIVSFITVQFAYSKNCSSSDITKAISSKKRFDYDAEKCTNTGAISVSKGIRLGGGVTIDGKNKLKLTWTGTGSQCDEIPRNHTYATFYTDGNDNVIKNLTIVKSPEGIHFYKGKGNVVENVTFEKICEDAITNGHKGSGPASGSVVRNSFFNNAPDKAIQCNGGSITVQNSVFKNIPRSVAGCTYKADGSNHGAKECPNPCNIKVLNNKVYGCSGGYAFRGSGYLQGKKKGTLTGMNNWIKDCSTPFMASQYGEIYAEANEVVGSCEQLAKSEQNGSGSVCNNKSSCKRLTSGNIKSQCLKSTPLVADTQQTKTFKNKDLQQYIASAQASAQSDNLSNEELVALACSRAQDRALVNAQQMCLGTVIKQIAKACDNSCKSKGLGVQCESQAAVTCRYGAR